MLWVHVIRPFQTKWGVPIVLPPKSLSLRLGVGCWRKYTVTVRDSYPLLMVVACIEWLREAQMFSTLDENYWDCQVAVDRKGQNKIAFTTNLLLYLSFCMLFGPENVSGTFEPVRGAILKTLKLQFSLVDLHSIIVFPISLLLHVEIVCQLPLLISDAGVTIKLKSCFFSIATIGVPLIRPGSHKLHNTLLTKVQRGTRGVEILINTGLYTTLCQLIHV